MSKATPLLAPWLTISSSFYKNVQDARVRPVGLETEFDLDEYSIDFIVFQALFKLFVLHWTTWIIFSAARWEACAVFFRLPWLKACTILSSPQQVHSAIGEDLQRTTSNLFEDIVSEPGVQLVGQLVPEMARNFEPLWAEVWFAAKTGDSATKISHGYQQRRCYCR